jgi:hypothetical protein
LIVIRQRLNSAAKAAVYPPFWMAFLVSAVCLAVFAVWVYSDRWFAFIFNLLLPPEIGPGEVASYDNLRPAFQTRITWFIVLAAIAVVATGFAALRLFIGRRSGRSVIVWLAFTGLFGAWLGFLLSYDRIKDAGFRQRTRENLSELQSIADAITAHRGPEQTVSTVAGTYLTDRIRMPNGYYLQAQWWTSTQPFALVRLTDGGLLMAYAEPSRFYVEFHPDDQQPSVKHLPTSILPLGNKLSELTHSESLGDGWFLTAYDE